MARVTVDGVEKLRARLQAAKAKAKDVAAIVGFTANYALYVHEDLTAHHPVGQAKFLEQPARQLQEELVQSIAEASRQGATLEHSILVAALRLQREAQLLCPVKTGLLKASAFTRLEGSDQPVTEGEGV